MRMIFKIYIIQAILVTLLGLSFMARPESWDSGKWNSTIDYNIYYGQFKNMVFTFQVIIAGLILAVLTFVAFYWAYDDLKDWGGI